MKVTRTIAVTVNLPVTVTVQVAAEVDDLAELDDVIWGVAAVSNPIASSVDVPAFMHALTAEDMERVDELANGDEAAATQVTEPTVAPRRRVRGGKR